MQANLVLRCCHKQYEIDDEPVDDGSKSVEDEVYDDLYGGTST
jgi:hypothetical protein